MKFYKKVVFCGYLFNFFLKMIIELKFNLPEKLYLKDPQGTKYGNKLLENSVLLIDELGFEGFTFKKLADKINSTETSIYRYFENKHLLLLYLNCWYWEWMHYLINVEIKNMSSPEARLQKVIYVIVNAPHKFKLTPYVDEAILHKVVVIEGTKSYHIHSVDSENKDGLFVSYKELVECMVEVVKGVQPDFDYPRALCSTLFEMANNQLYFAQHLPRLTDLKFKDDMLVELEKMLLTFAKKMLV